MTTVRHDLFSSAPRALVCPSAVRHLALAAWLLVASIAQAGEAPKNTPPFTRFKVTRFGVLNVTLPFDVPFILWGDVSTGTTHVSMKIAVVGRGATCTTVPATEFRELNRVETHNWLAVDYTDRNETPPIAAPETDGLVQFELVASPLEPSRVYCLMFQTEPGRGLLPAELITLREALLPAYERFVEELGERDREALRNRREDQIEPLRRQLVGAVLAADPLGSFRPLPQSAFDLNADPAKVQVLFLDGALRVFSPYLAALDQLQEFQFVENLPGAFTTAQQRHDELEAHWRAWRDSPEFSKLAGAAQNDEQRRAIEYLAGLNERQRANQFVGLPTGSRSEVLRRVSTYVPDFPAPPSSTGIYPSEQPCPSTGQVSTRCIVVDQLRARLELARGAATAAMLTQLATNIGASIADIGGQKIRLLNVQNLRNDAHTAAVRVIENLQGTVLDSIKVVTTTHAGAETRRSWYISLDTGIAVAPVINEIFPYAGSNIYFRPVNKDAPPGPFLTRFAALAGFTWTTNLKKEGQRNALYGESAMLLVGAGLRMTEVLRANGGALLFKSPDPNPLLNKTRLSFTPFFAISADIDIGGIVAGVFGARPQPKPGG